MGCEATANPRMPRRDYSPAQKLRDNMYQNMERNIPRDFKGEFESRDELVHHGRCVINHLDQSSLMFMNEFTRRYPAKFRRLDSRGTAYLNTRFYYFSKDFRIVIA